MTKNTISKITESDFLYSQWLHIKPRKAFSIIGIILLILVLICSAWALIGCIFYGLGFSSLIWVIFLITYFPGLIYIRTRKIKKIYAQSKFLHEEISISINDESYVCETASTKNNVKYSDVVKFKSDKKMLLVYLNDFQFSIFPKNNAEIILIADEIETRIKNAKLT